MRETSGRPNSAPAVVLTLPRTAQVTLEGQTIGSATDRDARTAKAVGAAGSSVAAFSTGAVGGVVAKETVGVPASGVLAVAGPASTAPRLHLMGDLGRRRSADEALTIEHRAAGAARWFQVSVAV